MIGGSQELAVIGDALDSIDDPEQNAIDFLVTVDVTFEDQFVKNNLEEILVLLLSENGAANGKQLTEQVATVFDTVVSSGTLYPALYDLEDDDLLAVEEHIRTKEYRIQDHDRAEQLLQNWLKQHFVLGAVFTQISTY